MSTSAPLPDELTLSPSSRLDLTYDKASPSFLSRSLPAPHCGTQGEPSLATYRAIYILQGEVRRATFQAATPAEAKSLAKSWGMAFEGAETALPPGRTEPGPTEACNREEACRQLGGISRTHLYRLLCRRKLKRLGDTRRVLVTLESIRRYRAESEKNC